VEHMTGLLEPCFIVPPLARFVGFVSPPIRGEYGFHFQLCQRFEELANAPHVLRDVVIDQISEILWTIDVVELMLFSVLIRVVHIGNKELRGGLAGFSSGVSASPGTRTTA
jgi:hypothetical protein